MAATSTTMAILAAPAAVAQATKAIADIQKGIASLLLVLPVLQEISQVVAAQQLSGSPVPTSDEQARLTAQEEGLFQAADAAITAKEGGSATNPATGT